MFGTLKARIAANVKILANGCHEWQGKRVKSAGGKEYGRMNVYDANLGKTVTRLVHREVLRLKLGRPLRADEVGRHKCDYTLCCNEAHLTPGTQTQNMADMVKRGRHAAQQRKAKGG